MHHQYELTEVHLPIVVNVDFCHDCVHLVEQRTHVVAVMIIDVMRMMAMLMVILFSSTTKKNDLRCVAHLSLSWVPPQSP